MSQLRPKWPWLLLGITGGIAFFAHLNLAPIQGDDADVRYIPFHIETLQSVSTHDIDGRAFYSFKIESSSRRQELFSILNACRRSGFSFNNKKVRMKLQVNRKAYFLDSDGIRRSGPSSIYALSDCQTNREEVKGIIEKLIKEQAVPSRYTAINK